MKQSAWQPGRKSCQQVTGVYGIIFPVVNHQPPEQLPFKPQHGKEIFPHTAAPGSRNTESDNGHPAVVNLQIFKKRTSAAVPVPANDLYPMIRSREQTVDFLFHPGIRPASVGTQQDDIHALIPAFREVIFFMPTF